MKTIMYIKIVIFALFLNEKPKFAKIHFQIIKRVTLAKDVWTSKCYFKGKEKNFFQEVEK